MATPWSDPTMLSGRRIRISRNSLDDYNIIIHDGNSCGLFPKEFKVISVFIPNPQLSGIGRLVVSLLLEEVKGHRDLLDDIECVSRYPDTQTSRCLMCSL